jgi:hypothetical protein
MFVPFLTPQKGEQWLAAASAAVRRLMKGRSPDSPQKPQRRQRY